MVSWRGVRARLAGVVCQVGYLVVCSGCGRVDGPGGEVLAEGVPDGGGLPPGPTPPGRTAALPHRAPGRVGGC